ncbi:LuxR C-terminal-related transcriptional regulator [Modestobacter sp. URMC 112]
MLAPPVAARLWAPAADAPTAREVQVLAGVARGLTNAEIGRELFIAEAVLPVLSGPDAPAVEPHDIRH